MIRTESALLVLCGIPSGIAWYFYKKCKYLRAIIGIQQDSIELMKDYIESEESYDGDGTESYL